MHIDWFTFTAQVVNFLVLVALLRWLLYGPIVRAMQEREAKIARRLEEATAKQEQAAETVQAYEDKHRQLDEHREAELKQARQQAYEEQQRLLKEARQEVDHHRQQWQDALRREQQDFMSDLRQQAAEMGLHAARHILKEVADVELEQQICEAFLSQLQQLDAPQREKLEKHLSESQVELVLRSAFELSEVQRRRFRDLLQQAFSTSSNVSFAQDKELICGLELDLGGYSYGWNVQEFLRDLDVDFSQRMRG